MSSTSRILAALALLSLPGLAAPACGGDSDTANPSSTSSTATGTGGQGQGGNGTAGSGATSAGGGGSGGDTGGGAGIKQCIRTCMAPADCASKGAQQPFDADNWACEQNRCRWLGCLSDEECMFFGGVCRLGAVSNDPVKTCTEACSNGPDVCAEMLASVDADNWTCPDGGCKYIGCLSDEECMKDFGDGAKCQSSGNGFPQCVKPCKAPADCVGMGAPPSLDADNYECKGGLCIYAGCTDDDECTKSEGLPAICAAP